MEGDRVVRRGFAGRKVAASFDCRRSQSSAKLFSVRHHGLTPVSRTFRGRPRTEATIPTANGLFFNSFAAHSTNGLRIAFESGEGGACRR